MEAYLLTVNIMVENKGGSFLYGTGGVRNPVVAEAMREEAKRKAAKNRKISDSIVGNYDTSLLSVGDDGKIDFNMGAKEAALEGARIRSGGIEDAMGFYQDTVSPYVDRISDERVSYATDLAFDPEAQLSFLQDNPLFEGLKDQIREASFRSQSARGDLGGSGTDQILSNEFLRAGTGLINEQLMRMNPLIADQISLSERFGGNVGNYMRGIADEQATGLETAYNVKRADQIASANRSAQKKSDLVGLAGTLGGAALGGPVGASIGKAIFG